MASDGNQRRRLVRSCVSLAEETYDRLLALGRSSEHVERHTLIAVLASFIGRAINHLASVRAINAAIGDQGAVDCMIIVRSAIEDYANLSWIGLQEDPMKRIELAKKFESCQIGLRLGYLNKIRATKQSVRNVVMGGSSPTYTDQEIDSKIAKLKQQHEESRLMFPEGSLPDLDAQKQGKWDGLGPTDMIRLAARSMNRREGASDGTQEENEVSQFEAEMLLHYAQSSFHTHGNIMSHFVAHEEKQTGHDKAMRMMTKMTSSSILTCAIALDLEDIQNRAFDLLRDAIKLRAS